VEQNSTTSRKFHSVTIRRSAASGQALAIPEIDGQGNPPPSRVADKPGIYRVGALIEMPGSLIYGFHGDLALEANIGETSSGGRCVVFGQREDVLCANRGPNRKAG
jgi:hypothetical protein